MILRTERTQLRTWNHSLLYYFNIKVL